MKKTILFFLVPIILYFALQNFIENQKELITITLLISTVFYWATNLVPDYHSSLIFMFTSLSLSLSTKELIFSGFSSSAFWLVFAGMLIATAIKKVELSHHISAIFIRLKKPSYLFLLISISIFSMCFAFVMPSGVGRVVLLVPISIIVAKSFGFKESDKGYIGIILCFILSSTFPGFTILPANAPNMIMAGLIGQIYHHDILYSQYLLMNFLILGLLKNIILVILIFYIFKDSTSGKDKSKQKIIKKTKEQKILIISLIIMIAFWLSDFIHGINPSIIAIAGVLFLSFPKIGILDVKDINSVNFTSLIFLAGVVSLGSVASHTHVTKDALIWTLNHFSFFDSKLLNYMSITTFMSLSGILLTQATIPAIYTPVANEISSLSGFNIQEIFMMQVAAFSTVFFPYQIAPFIIGVKLAKIKQIYMFKIISILGILTILFLFPLQYLWLNYLKL